MKRKILVMFAAMSLVVSVFAMNSLAYNTKSIERLGTTYNSADHPRTAYGKLNPSGGYGEIQIRNSSGNTIYARGSYPVSNPNNDYTTHPIASCTTYSFYANSLNGSQIWGSASYGVRD